MLRALPICACLLACAAVPARGATATVASDFFPDYVDPALSYTQDGWSILWLTHTGLLTYARAEGQHGLRLIPGLAEGLPAVSPDGRTYTLTLRPGLHYPNGRGVRAADFEHSVKRVLAMESEGSVFFHGIVGAARYERRGRARGNIAGITSNEATRTITIRLGRADGAFAHVLAMPFAGLVPSGTAFRNLTRRPPPGIGPFRIASSRPNRGVTLRRNPGFALPDVPAAGVDELRIRVNRRRGSSMGDLYVGEPPPSRRAADRYREIEAGNTFFFFLNQRTRPFNRKEVRQAVNFALDKPALSRRAVGGLLTPGCTFLPPLLAPERAMEPCPYGDPNGPPQLDRARELVRAAGARGARVKVWVSDERDSQRNVRVLIEALRAIGLRASMKVVRAERYFIEIGDRRNRAQIGFANWFQDFPHPSNFLLLVDPANIRRRGNMNWGNVGDARIRGMLADANRKPLSEAAATYAAIDRILVEEAYLVPYGQRRMGFQRSARVPPPCLVSHPVYTVDYSRICVAG